MMSGTWKTIALGLTVAFCLLAPGSAPAAGQSAAPEAPRDPAAQVPPADSDNGIGTGENGGNEGGENPEDDQTELPMDALMRNVGPTFEKTSVYGWLGLFGGILAGLIVGKLVSFILKSTGGRLQGRGLQVPGLVIQDAANPLSLTLFAFGLAAGLAVVYMEDPVRDFSLSIIVVMHYLAMGWFLYNLVDIIELALIKVTSKTETKLDDMMVPMIRKALRIFLVVVFTLFVANSAFGVDITAWLAGLGLAGLAISLAAQDSIKNLFGSLMILLDHPFMVDDFIRFDGEVGKVEEIGFRSTKIRLLSGHLITMPNMKFIDNKVENITARPYIRRQMDVTITYDTPPEKIDEAVTILKQILSDEQVIREGRFNMEDNAPKVSFNELNADSLNIRGYYWYQMDGDPDRGFFSYLEHCELVNRKLFRRYADAGIEFAFPTQTLYLAGDPARQLGVDVRIAGDK